MTLTTIRCSECNTPIMEVEGREIIVKARHHGKQHVTVVRIEDLEERHSLHGHGLVPPPPPPDTMNIFGGND